MEIPHNEKVSSLTLLLCACLAFTAIDPIEDSFAPLTLFDCLRLIELFDFALFIGVVVMCRFEYKLDPDGNTRWE